MCHAEWIIKSLHSNHSRLSLEPEFTGAFFVVGWSWCCCPSPNPLRTCWGGIMHHTQMSHSIVRAHPEEVVMSSSSDGPLSLRPSDLHHHSSVVVELAGWLAVLHGFIWICMAQSLPPEAAVSGWNQPASESLLNNSYIKPRNPKPLTKSQEQ